MWGIVLGIVAGGLALAKSWESRPDGGEKPKSQDELLAEAKAAGRAEAEAEAAERAKREAQLEKKILKTIGQARVNQGIE